MSTRQTYTGYTETDSNARITVAANTLTIAGLLGNDTSHVYKDMTASYFSGDFEHTLTFTCTVNTSSPNVYLWGLTNGTTALGTSVAAGTTILLAVSWHGSDRYLTIHEGNGSTVATSAGTTALTVGSQYWLRIVRDETVSTYGTLYAYIYSNAEMTELVEVVSLDLRVATDFRYLWAVSGEIGGSGSASWTGTVKNLTLDQYAYSQQNILSLLRTLLAEPTAASWTDTQLKAYINQAIREIAATSGCVQHIDSATTTNATRLVSFTGYRVHAVEYIPSSGTPYYLKKILPVQVNHVPLSGTAPQFWFEYGSSIGIEPLPDATYNLSLYVEDVPPADITVVTAAPPLRRIYNNLIVWKALQLAYEQDNKMAPAQQMYSIYRNELAFLIQQYEGNVPDGTLDLGFI